MSTSAKVRTFRLMMKELKNTLPENQSLKDLASYGYIKDQYKKNQTTSEQYCREKEEMAYMAQTYSSYLHSSRK